MPRQKKQHLKRRKDGRFACRYKNLWFYGDTEDEALQAREQYKDAEKRGDVSRMGTGPTVAEYALKWLPIARPNVADSTYQESAGLMNKLLWIIGDRFIRDILPSDIKQVYSTAFRGMSDSYIRSAKQLYIALFNAAVADRYCRRNPATEKAAQPHRGTKGGHRAITAQERKWINTLCRDHRCFPAVMAMLYEGLRPPEAKAFDIDKSVDWDARVVRIIDFAHKGERGVYQITGKGKTEKSVRDIPLFSPFAKAIEGKTGKLVPTVRGGELTEQAWHVLWQSYTRQMEKAINGMEKRWYMRTRAHKKILAEAEQLRKAGDEDAARAKEQEIPPWISFTVRPYDLRHSFATYCRDAGIELNTVVQWMGHADANMVLRIYDEVSVDRTKKEAEKLEKALIGSQNGSQKRVFHINRSKIKHHKA